jgi:primosomal protein N' (replication factor Y)
MTGRFANIIVDISHENVDRPFQYLIPDDMRDRLQVGMVVMIPFGKGNKLIKGYVMEITDRAEYDVAKLKAVSSIIEDGVSADGDYIRLAWWIKENYGSTMIAALKTVLPVKEKSRPIVKKTIISKVDSDKAYICACDFEAKHQKAKARLMRELSQTPILPLVLVTGKLNISSQTITSLVNGGLIEVKSEDSYRSALPKNLDSKAWRGNAKKQLSDNQRSVAYKVIDDLNNNINKTYLLHGVTGSGKTEVYMEIIESVVEKGGQAIVLIPEIALTYQTLIRFYQRFGDRVSVMNSKLSKAERSDQFERAKNGDIDIMIGPRSALFTPFENLGLIIIDEEHEASYKSESMPKYHAREVAAQICRMKKASLVLGSATPSVESYYRAKNGEIELLELNERISGGELPKVYVEDLREELKSGNRSIFSRRLQGLIEDRLSKGEQTMLFINRRGYSGFVSCRSCGYVVKCPHCDVSLSEHADRYRNTSKLVCHYCGYETKSVNICPQCGSKYIMGFRAGTQQIEEMLVKEFPTARVLRMDADTTRAKDGYEQILSKFANEEADILVGTQMIVKGHDFGKVTLVGVLAADLSLHSGDYRAGERTFQLLTQAAGRAGRSKLPGEVVIQTYQPDNYTIIHAANQDYKGFYEEEMSYRDLMMYPPVAHMMAVLVLSNDEMTGNEHIRELADRARLRYGEKKPRIIGPAPASVGKINDVFRYVFYVKHRDYQTLVDIKDDLEDFINSANWSNDSVQFDFNPMNNY